MNGELLAIDALPKRTPPVATARASAARMYGFAFLIFALFFFQDLINLILLRAGLGDAVPWFSALKEVLVVAFCGIYVVVNVGRLRFGYPMLMATVALAAAMVFHVALGLLRYPATGVVYELRTLMMPVALIFFGWIYVRATEGDPAYVERLVSLGLRFSALFAASALIDYLFLGDEFWIAVNIGAMERLKGYELVAVGTLPDNMYSYYFGRRALGLAFNPLNLGYILVPAVVIAWCRHRWALAALVSLALILSWSRLPIVATAAVLLAAATPVSVRFLLALVAVPVVGWYAVDVYQALQHDPSALGHFSTLAIGTRGLVDEPWGHGVGAAGIYAGAYSVLSVESVLLNVANQIGLLGLLLYTVVLAAGLFQRTPLSREVRLIAAAYGLTLFLSPHLLVIKSTFVFFVLLGVCLGWRGARSQRSARPEGGIARPPPGAASATGAPGTRILQ